MTKLDLDLEHAAARMKWTEFMEKQEIHTMICPNWNPPDPRGMFIATALAGEAGELLNNMKKAWRDGETPELEEKIMHEVADIGNYFFMMCKHKGWSPLHICAVKLLEFEKRPEYQALLKRLERGE